MQSNIEGRPTKLCHMDVLLFFSLFAISGALPKYLKSIPNGDVPPFQDEPLTGHTPSGPPVNNPFGRDFHYSSPQHTYTRDLCQKALMAMVNRTGSSLETSVACGVQRVVVAF